MDYDDAKLRTYHGVRYFVEQSPSSLYPFRGYVEKAGGFNALTAHRIHGNAVAEVHRTINERQGR